MLEAFEKNLNAAQSGGMSYEIFMQV